MRKNFFAVTRELAVDQLSLLNRILPRAKALKLGLLITQLFCLVVLAHAQDELDSKRGFYPGGSYAISDIESINTANGNLIVNIPIAALPPGRNGRPGPGFSLTYNSKIWDVEKTFIPGDPQTGGAITFNDLTPSPEGGWRFNLPVYTINNGDEDFVPNGTQCNGGYVHKVTVTFPDGSRHEFFPSGYTLKYSSGGQKYSRIRLDGWQASAVQTSGDCLINHTLQTTNTMTYFSIDGTYLRLDVLHDFQNAGHNPWILYFPDGTRVETSTISDGIPDVQRTYDRNNNYTEFQRINNYNGQTNRVAYKIIDEFNRSILLEEAYFSPTSTVIATGINGTPLQWTITSGGGSPAINKTYCSHFAVGGTCDTFMDVNVNLSGLEQISLPSQLGGLSYHFSYNASSGGWGELSSITLPSGAVANYHYEQDGQNQISWHKVRNNGVAQKDLTYQLEYDQTSTSSTESWFYTYNRTTGATTITAPDQGVTTEYHLGNDATLGDQARGLLYKRVNPDGSVEENVWQTNTPAGIAEFSNQPFKLNLFLKTKFVSITNSAGQLVKTGVTDYSYDKNGNITATREYDWIDPSSVQRDVNGNPLDGAHQPALTSALLKRLSTKSFYLQTPDASDTTTNDPNVYSKGSPTKLRSLIVASEIGTGTQVQSRTEFTYDDPNSSGNVIQEKRWDSTKGAYTSQLTTGNSISTSNQYGTWASGATGKLITSTDARGVQTKLTYGTVGTTTDLYATTTETALGTPVQRTESREYDFDTGLITKTTDVENGISTKTTYDAVGRPILVQAAFGLPEETRTATQYFDSARKVIVRSDLNVMGDAKLVSIQHYDQLGRIRLTRSLEDSSVTDAETSETIGIKVQTRYLKTTGASYTLTSNPYRAALSSNAGTEVSMGWTRTKTDIVGRVVEVQTFAGQSLPSPWGNNTVSTGTVSTSSNGVLKTVMDQSQKIRRSKRDALGRLIRVDEPMLVGSADELDDANGNPRQPTDYSYDALGNLTNLSQGGQSRVFVYSSLSRLVSAQNPESGTQSYKYDDAGNLKVKTDARGVSTHFNYDELNRITARWYNSSAAISDVVSNGSLPANVGTTEQANFYYDSHPAFSPFIAFQSQDKSKGRLTAVTYGANNSTVGDYYRSDSLGRAFSKIQRVGDKNYQVSAQYNLANTIKQVTYPSGHIVVNNFDTTGRINGLTGNLGAGGATRSYSSGILYSPAGALVAEQFGTTVPIFNKLFYNSRGQLAEIRESTSYSGPNDMTWDRGAIVNHYSDQCSGMCAPDADGPKAMTDNNGNLRKQEIFIPNAEMVWQQYSYDSLNRLQWTREVKTGNEQWRQWFKYDRWGNRRIDNSDGGDGHAKTWGAGINNLDFELELDPQQIPTNRLLAPGDSSTSVNNRKMRYDNAGNLVNDSWSGFGSLTAGTYTRKYDGENRMVIALDNTGGNTTYTYDSSGQRVRRRTGSVETWQIYGISGELIAEYSENGSESAPQREYGYRNGQLLVTASVGEGWGAAPTFTGPNPLIAGSQIQLEHLTDLRSAVNQLRAHAGLPAFVFTVDPTPVRNVTTIKAEHIRQLRTALEQAKSQLALSTGGYAHPTLTENGSLIYAIDFQELRDQILSAWQTGSSVEIDWLVTDQLGTPRIILDESGSLAGVSRHDYLPYGEEISVGVSGRDAAKGYGSGDGLRQQFTGKERDNETKLDYFEARYYASLLGRFASTDPVGITAHHIANPQRWNLYVYVNNNPLVLYDPDGRDPQGKPARTIDIFLTFQATDREYTGSGRSRVYDSAPDYDALIKLGRENGFDVRVHQDSGTTVAQHALERSEVVTFVGHGLGPTTDGKFTATDIKLGSGVIGTFGVQQTTTVNGVITATTEPTEYARNNAAVTGLFTCNSQDRLGGAFRFGGTNQSVVVNSGGNAGLTSIGTLEKANYAFIQQYIRTNGNPQQPINVEPAIAAAQAVIAASARTIPSNRDGDTIRRYPRPLYER